LDEAASAARERLARLMGGEVDDRSVALYKRHLDVFVRYLAAHDLSDTSG
jgi:hypothetical protein